MPVPISRLHIVAMKVRCILRDDQSGEHVQGQYSETRKDSIQERTRTASGTRMKQIEKRIIK